MPKRTRKESVLGPMSKIVPHLRKESTIFPPLPQQDIQVCVLLFISLLHLCEVEEGWGGRGYGGVGGGRVG